MNVFIAYMNRLITFYFLFFTVYLHAQSPIKNKVLRYSLKDGLSSGFINNIIQDKKGFMWFATSDGLNRFDGVNFKVFKFDSSNPYSLPSNFIDILYIDTQGDIWISSRRGVYRFDTNTDRYIKFEPTGDKTGALNSVTSISGGGNGIIWFTCYANIFSYNKSTHQLIRYYKKNLPILSNKWINMVFQDSKGLLWIGTEERILGVYNVRNGIIIKKINYEVPLELIPKTHLNLLYEDHDHNVWVATTKGLAFYDRDGNTVKVFEGSKYHLRSNNFSSLLEDDNNNLMIGLLDGGLYKLDLKKTNKSPIEDRAIEPVRSDEGTTITERTIQSLYQDKDKNIWVGTYGDGIYMLSNVPEKFKKFENKLTDAYGTSSLRYYGMCIDAEGFLWLGTDGDGIYKKNKNGVVIKHYYADGKKGSLVSNAILYAFMDHSNTLWFGSYANGLFKYDKKTDSFIHYWHKENDAKSLCNNDVRMIFENSAHDLWIGTNGGGISVLRNGENTFTNYNTLNSNIGSNNARTICEDNKGNLYVGVNSVGLMCYIKNKNTFIPIFKKAQIDKFFRSNVILALKFYDRNKLLIGTEGEGLIIYNVDTKKLKQYSEKEGLANNTINAIQPDENNNIWVSNNKGLSKIETQTGKIVNYDTSNGLQTGQFSPNSVMYSTKDKFICFGGTEGYNIFFPDQIKKDVYKPKVIITGLQLFGKDVGVGQKDNILNQVIDKSDQIELKPDQSVFSFQYVALNYTHAEKSEFAYQLVGLDKTWNYVGNQKYATYRYLEPGSYIFKVKASNQDGIWFDDYASVKIAILPPWYKTWWAYLIYVVIMSIIIYYYMHYKANQAKLKYDIKIAQLSAEKEKELNERKISFFTNISHEFRTPLTLIINPVKDMLFGPGEKTADSGNLSIVYRNARRLLSLVDQLLLFRKAESDTNQLKLVKLNIVSLCREVFLCFNHQARTKNIQFDFFSTSETIEIFADREKIEIALFNLISNALKFTPEHGVVTCTITDTDTNLTIEIKDTGCGIPEFIGEQLFNKFYQVQNTAPLAGGFGIGLYLVKVFVESHKGEVCYKSKSNEGTSFIVHLLKGREHLSSHFIFEDVAETSVFLDELIENKEEFTVTNKDVNRVIAKNTDPLSSENKTMLLVEDNVQIREYLKQIFIDEFEVFEADNGTDGLNMVYQLVPDIVISDVMMQGLSGIELCSRVKEDNTLNHIPVILLTASTSPEIKLKGIEGGADDYISKPFEKEILIARVKGILKSKNNLQKYFFNEITLKPNDLKISPEYKEFLEKCLKIVENHLNDPEFSIKTLAAEIGMSHSNLYKRIKSISGQSASSFIRFIRLRKAAEIFLSTDSTVYETAYKVGINDLKYFREQFNKLFGLNPSDYIKKYRKPFHNNYNVSRNVIKNT